MPRLPALRHSGDLAALLERAIRHRVTLVCGSVGTGKTAGRARWAARRLGILAIWLTLSDDADQSLFWAQVYDGLLRASGVAEEALRMLADVTALEFPLRLADVIRSHGTPVVAVVDNAHDATSDSLLSGLDLLVRHAPPNLHIVLAGQAWPPLPQLARLAAIGEMAVVSPAELAWRAAR